MEPINQALRVRILAAVEQWAAERYDARLRELPAEQIALTRAGSDSEFDYFVSLNALEGPAPLRVKVTLAPDGSLQIRD